MRLTVVGCGDAFGSGGRLQTCYHVDLGGSRFLIDCGASALIGLNRLGLDANAIGTIFISHLHGDHFGGLVWWLLHGQHVARRTVPLDVVGPVAIEKRFIAAAEALFPRSTATERRFEMRFHELVNETPLTINGVTVTPFEVAHPSGSPPYALRLEAGAKTLGFSGDTHWVDNVARAAEGADLMLIECYGYDAEVRYHMAWKRIEAELPRLKAKRIMLTHMNAGMLAKRHLVTAPGIVLAEDGLVLEV